MQTEQERLEYLNKELGTDYKSLKEVNWDYISWNLKLSEDFIREFANEVVWEYISCTQKLSENFIIKTKVPINIKGIYCLYLSLN